MPTRLEYRKKIHEMLRKRLPPEAIYLELVKMFLTTVPYSFTVGLGVKSNPAGTELMREINGILEMRPGIVEQQTVDEVSPTLSERSRAEQGDSKRIDVSMAPVIRPSGRFARSFESATTVSRSAVNMSAGIDAQVDVKEEGFGLPGMIQTSSLQRALTRVKRSQHDPTFKSTSEIIVLHEEYFRVFPAVYDENGELIFTVGMLDEKFSAGIGNFWLKPINLSRLLDQCNDELMWEYFNNPSDTTIVKDMLEFLIKGDLLSDANKRFLVDQFIKNSQWGWLAKLIDYIQQAELKALAAKSVEQILQNIMSVSWDWYLRGNAELANLFPVFVARLEENSMREIEVLLLKGLRAIKELGNIFNLNILNLLYQVVEYLPAIKDEVDRLAGLTKQAGAEEKRGKGAETTIIKSVTLNPADGEDYNRAKEIIAVFYKNYLHYYDKALIELQEIVSSFSDRIVEEFIDSFEKRLKAGEKPVPEGRLIVVFILGTRNNPNQFYVLMRRCLPQLKKILAENPSDDSVYTLPLIREMGYFVKAIPDDEKNPNAVRLLKQEIMRDCFMPYVTSDQVLAETSRFAVEAKDESCCNMARKAIVRRFNNFTMPPPRKWKWPGLREHEWCCVINLLKWSDIEVFVKFATAKNWQSDSRDFGIALSKVLLGDDREKFLMLVMPSICSALLSDLHSNIGLEMYQIFSSIIRTSPHWLELVNRIISQCIADAISMIQQYIDSQDNGDCVDAIKRIQRLAEHAENDDVFTVVMMSCDIFARACEKPVRKAPFLFELMANIHKKLNYSQRAYLMDHLMPMLHLDAHGMPTNHAKRFPAELFKIYMNMVQYQNEQRQLACVDVDRLALIRRYLPPAGIGNLVEQYIGGPASSARLRL